MKHVKTGEVEQMCVSVAQNWSAVTPVYRAYEGNTLGRDTDGYPGYHCTNTTGRNDFVESRVTYDAENVYFMVKTADAITPYTDKTTLKRSIGGWNREAVATVDDKVDGNTMVVTIPRAALGIADGDFTVNFKWSDNMQVDGDIMDFYTNGDVAPGARYKYSFISTSENEGETEEIESDTTPDTTPDTTSDTASETSAPVEDATTPDTSADTRPAKTGGCASAVGVLVLPFLLASAWLVRRKESE